MNRIVVTMVMMVALVATLGFANDFEAVLGTLNAKTGDRIVCGHLGALPSTTGTITYLFGVNGVSTASTFGNVACGVDIPACSKGDSITCTIVLQDGPNTYTADANNLTVQNTPPDAPVIILNTASPTTNEDLVCTLLSGGSDADGDSVELQFSWEYKTGPNDPWILFASNTGNSIADVPSTQTREGQFWRCSVYATDGESFTYGQDATATVQESTRDSTVQDQWYVPFGKYDAEVNATFVNNRLLDRTQVTDPTIVEAGTPFAFSYVGRCMFAECGDTAVEILHNNLPIPYAFIGVPTGIYMYTFNPQTKDDYYPNLAVPSISGALLSLGQSSCLESMKDTLAYRSCTTHWIAHVNAALGTSYTVETEWCSAQYPNDVRCLTSESLTFKVGLFNRACTDITRISIVPPYQEIVQGGNGSISLIASYISGPDQIITSDPNVTWTNTDPSIAAAVAGQPSLYQGLALGITTIGAEFCGLSSNATINVTNSLYINYSRICEVGLDQDDWLQTHYDAEYPGDPWYNLFKYAWEIRTPQLITNLKASREVESRLLFKDELEFMNIKDFFDISDIKPVFWLPITRNRVEKIWEHEGFTLQRRGSAGIDGLTWNPIYSACRHDPKDTALCHWVDQCKEVGCCVYEGQCFAHGESLDVDSDRVIETCVANSPGIWVEPVTGNQNFCNSTVRSTCSEDGSLYGAAVGAQSYVESPESIGLYCAWPAGATDWNWTFVPQPPENITTFESFYGEVCGDGYGTSGENIDNNCNAFKVYEETATNVYDFTRYIEGSEVYDVYEDVDAFDVACMGDVSVTVIDGVSGLPLENANVILSLNNDRRTDSTYRSVSTNSTGQVFISPLPATSYKFIATLPGYAATSVEHFIGYRNSTELIISLQKSECTDQCTRSGVDIAQVCDLSCDGINGCSFTTATDSGSGDPIRNLLAGIPVGAQIDYVDSGDGFTYTVNTCEGDPRQIPSDADREAQITCEGGDIALVDTVVLYQGKPVKLKVVTCR